MLFKASAVLTGKVDFSTMILLFLATLAICRAQSSICFKSAAIPFPVPYVLVGVFTDIKIRSASSMALSTSVEKNKFFPRTLPTISFNPGSYIGILLTSLSFQAAILASFKSTTVTLISGHFWAITAMVGPPTYPAPIQQIFLIFIFIFILNYYNTISRLL